MAPLLQIPRLQPLDMDEIIREIARRGDCEVVYRTKSCKIPFGEWVPYVEIGGKNVPLPKKQIHALAEIIQFRNRVSQMRIFKPSPVVRLNGWHIMDTDSWLYDTVNSNLVGDVDNGGIPIWNPYMFLGLAKRWG